MEDPPPDVAAALAALPSRVMDLRALIFAAANATGTAPLTETLKWGQPAYLPAKRAGTTLRLGVDAGQPTLFVPCSTNLLDRFRDAFPTEFTYSGARAVHLPAQGPFPQAAFQQIAAMALTYHRDKRR
ncbi:DUF1801 domain-containing protein [Rhodobacteraceae bacterium N5(2021)]|uniref:DUF1801 domain-containing protein n=1 Tax=Gymnodinialimonas phycosphaerae TaxID=2841589 RepID=A0A975TWU5_9RHOB|nr:DUF1801 domain-containing protein [Gymnodinialimonas phycosphaerae]MBY4891408.1 DUF1801 domain-containing protein [Gymnodinialimonas phycosphaerae]